MHASQRWRTSSWKALGAADHRVLSEGRYWCELGHAIRLCKLKVLAPAISAVTLSESFYLEEFMRVTCTQETGWQEKHSQSTGRERALAVHSSSSAQKDPSEGEGWVKNSSSVTAGMVIRVSRMGSSNCGLDPFGSEIKPINGL